jgi:hypothetical protein
MIRPSGSSGAWRECVVPSLPRHADSAQYQTVFNGRKDAQLPDIISDAVFRELYTPASIGQSDLIKGSAYPADLSTPVYSLGQIHTSYRGHRFVFHVGYLPGHYSVLGFCPTGGTVGYSLSVIFCATSKRCSVRLPQLRDRRLCRCRRYFGTSLPRLE